MFDVFGSGFAPVTEPGTWNVEPRIEPEHELRNPRTQKLELRETMYLRDAAEEKIQTHTIARLNAWRDSFRTDARDVRLVGVVLERVVHVVRQLAVDADRLEPTDDGVAGTFQHWPKAYGSGLMVLAC